MRAMKGSNHAAIVGAGLPAIKNVARKTYSNTHMIPVGARLRAIFPIAGKTRSYKDRVNSDQIYVRIAFSGHNPGGMLVFLYRIKTP